MGTERAAAGRASAELTEPASAGAGGGLEARSLETVGASAGALPAGGAAGAGRGVEPSAPAPSWRAGDADAALGARGAPTLGARGSAALAAGGRDSRGAAAVPCAANGLEATRGSVAGAVGRWLLSLARGAEALAARAAARASAFV